MPLNLSRYMASAIAAIIALPGFSAQAEDISFASQVSGIEFATMSTLPENKSYESDKDLCSAIITEPETNAGRKVADANWWVTGEIEKGDLTFVSFVGKFDIGTSGACPRSEGNIGVFLDEALQAIIYTDETASQSIGSIEALDGGNLRIWDGDYLSAAFFDMKIIDNNLIIIRQIADHDTFCGGAISAPTTFGLPINIARRLLISEDWQPVSAPKNEASSVVAQTQETIPELQDCSGTGFGFCSFEYSKGDEYTLTVVTAGEGEDDDENFSPAVVGFQVTCGTDEQG